MGPEKWFPSVNKLVNKQLPTTCGRYMSTVGQDNDDMYKLSHVSSNNSFELCYATMFRITSDYEQIMMSVN